MLQALPSTEAAADTQPPAWMSPTWTPEYAKAAVAGYRVGVEEGVLQLPNPFLRLQLRHDRRFLFVHASMERIGRLRPLHAHVENTLPGSQVAAGLLLLGSFCSEAKRARAGLPPPWAQSVPGAAADAEATACVVSCFLSSKLFLVGQEWPTPAQSQDKRRKEAAICRCLPDAVAVTRAWSIPVPDVVPLSPQLSELSEGDVDMQRAKLILRITVAQNGHQCSHGCLAIDAVAAALHLPGPLADAGGEIP
eukprot:s3399_g13.t1